MLPWQHYSRCHFVSFVMYITGAKFEDHCSNISGDVLNSVFYRFSGTIYDVIDENKQGSLNSRGIYLPIFRKARPSFFRAGSYRE